jgi:hypothetical protein
MNYGLRPNYTNLSSPLAEASAMADYFRGVLAMVLGLGFLASLAILGLGLFRALLAGNWFMAIVSVILWAIAIRAGIYFNQLVQQKLTVR